MILGGKEKKMSKKKQVPPGIRDTAECRGQIKHKKSKSPILDRSIPSFDTAFLNRRNVKNLLRSRDGEISTNPEKQGTFVNDDGKRVPCFRVQLQKRSKAVVDEYDSIQASRKREGKRELDQMPPELLFRYADAESDLVVCEEEIKALQNLLREMEAEGLAEEERLDVRRLMQGTGKIRSTPDQPRWGRLTELDGQRVEPDREGTLRICDPRSPYNGLPTADYLDLCKAYREEYWRLRTEHEKKWKREHMGEDLAEMPKAPHPPLPGWPEDIARPEAS